ncbi:MAG: aminotransferase class I/II-fold pyridoxal phosphate-dependent enzyme [Epsilonproteobacteria bacterium]|nr:aminotransferase class I/II-fold pyridoxal phosphate-dependent enzyme [Campylobacterota bacterium]
MYENELKAIHKSNRFRVREIFNESWVDLASNDYLGFAEDKDLLASAYKSVLTYKSHAPKASQLVNGYHPIHQSFEQYLCRLNGFDDAMVVGSGFLANLSLIEALPRKKDLLVMDALYHASGILASKLVDAKVVTFEHNNATELAKILESEVYERAIVCVEGIYSMEGDILNRQIFEVVDRSGVLLIVDEAHSSGVLGKHLLGVFEHYDIVPKSNHIKMGTLGKAYGSYGAYILADHEIISFLQNRAKAVIYATAPSVFDTALAYEGVKYTQANYLSLVDKRQQIQTLIHTLFDIQIEGLIFKIDVKDSQKALALKAFAQEKGFVIGAIRPPTVKTAILRIIPRLNVELALLRDFLLELRDEI